MTILVPSVDDMLITRQVLSGDNSAWSGDANLSETILSEFARFAEVQIAPLNSLGDVEGCILTPQGVELPTQFKTVYEQLAEAGWQGLSAPEAIGGMNLDNITAAGVSELFSGACHALQMVCNLVPGAIALVHNFGTDDQKERLIPPLVEGRWLSTMCLTEPDAGSDLSRIKCQAQEQDGVWTLTGEKIFISGGDQNISPSILHFVLARTGPASLGLKGLSLFACPKHLDDTQNQISILRLEDKLGIHASPTCHLRFNEAKAELIGSVGGGLKAMFTLMNHARIDVALQGVAHAHRAWALAYNYASERIQGRTKDKNPAKLADHPDVKRMLNEQRALTLGARALCYKTLLLMEAETNTDLVEFLTPLCKVFCSEAGIKSADLGIQILGGYGYLKDYQMEQIWRDARITSIYEGANGIHSKMMVTRNVHLADGKAADHFISLIETMGATNAQISWWCQQWKAARKLISQSDEPEQYGHDFTQFSARLFFETIWHELSTHHEAQNVFTPDLAHAVHLMSWPVRSDWLGHKPI